MTERTDIPAEGARLPWNLTLATLVMWGFFAVTLREQPPEFLGGAMGLTLFTAGGVALVARTPAGRAALELGPSGKTGSPSVPFMFIVLLAAAALVFALWSTPLLAILPATALQVVVARLGKRVSHWSGLSEEGDVALSTISGALVGAVMAIFSPWLLVAFFAGVFVNAALQVLARPHWRGVFG